MSGLALLGSLGALFGQAKMNQGYNDRAEILAQKQNAWNEKMIDKQNAYNSPANMRTLMENAHVNPDMMYSGGNLSSFGQTAAPTAAPVNQAEPVNVGDAIKTGFDALESLYRAGGQKISNKNMQRQFDDAHAQVTANVKSLQKSIDKFNSDISLASKQGEKIDIENKFNNMRYAIENGLKNGSYEVYNPISHKMEKLSYLGVMMQKFSQEHEKFMSHMRNDKRMLDDLFDNIADIVKGEVDAKKLVSANLDRINFDMTQDQAFSKTIDDLTGQGDKAKMIGIALEFVRDYLLSGKK